MRIPKELAYSRVDLEMEIELIGLARAFRAFGPGFMQEGRDQPNVPDREGAARRP